MKNNVVMSTIGKWISEANNPRNDGWVQSHYKEMLTEVARLLGNYSVESVKDDDAENTRLSELF